MDMVNLLRSLMVFTAGIVEYSSSALANPTASIAASRDRTICALSLALAVIPNGLSKTRSPGMQEGEGKVKDAIQKHPSKTYR